MARNRFEQVDEKQDDAITLSLWKAQDQTYGSVTVPKSLSTGKLPADLTTDKMSIKDAFRGAINLANQMKAPVVVMDPDSLWQKDWGDLYRPAD
jgi:hypothetical protein